MQSSSQGSSSADAVPGPGASPGAPADLPQQSQLHHHGKSSLRNSLSSLRSFKRSPSSSTLAALAMPGQLSHPAPGPVEQRATAVSTAPASFPPVSQPAADFSSNSNGPQETCSVLPRVKGAVGYALPDSGALNKPDSGPSVPGVSGSSNTAADASPTSANNTAGDAGAESHAGLPVNLNPRDDPYAAPRARGISHAATPEPGTSSSITTAISPATTATTPRPGWTTTRRLLKLRHLSKHKPPKSVQLHDHSLPSSLGARAPAAPAAAAAATSTSSLRRRKSDHRSAFSSHQPRRPSLLSMPLQPASVTASTAFPSPSSNPDAPRHAAHIIPPKQTPRASNNTSSTMNGHTAHSFDFLLEDDDDEKLSKWHRHRAAIFAHMARSPGTLSLEKIWYLAPPQRPSNTAGPADPMWKCALGSIDTKSRLTLADKDTQRQLAAYEIRSAKVRLDATARTIELRLEPGCCNSGRSDGSASSCCNGSDITDTATRREDTGCRTHNGTCRVAADKTGSPVSVLTLKWIPDGTSTSTADDDDEHFHQWVAAILLHANLKPPGLENKVCSPFQATAASSNHPADIIFEGRLQAYLPAKNDLAATRGSGGGPHAQNSTRRAANARRPCTRAAQASGSPQTQTLLRKEQETKGVTASAPDVPPQPQVPHSIASPFRSCKWVPVHATLYADGSLSLAEAPLHPDTYHTIDIGSLYSSGIRLLDRSVFDVPNVIFVGDRPFDDPQFSARLDRFTSPSLLPQPGLPRRTLHRENSAPAILRTHASSPLLNVNAPAYDGPKTSTSSRFPKLTPYNNLSEAVAVASAGAVENARGTPGASTLSLADSVLDARRPEKAAPLLAHSLSDAPKKRRSFHGRFKKSSTINLPHNMNSPLANNDHPSPDSIPKSHISSLKSLSHLRTPQNRGSAASSPAGSPVHSSRSFASVSSGSSADFSSDDTETDEDDEDDALSFDNSFSSTASAEFKIERREEAPFVLAPQPRDDSASAFLHFGDDAVAMKKWFAALKSVVRVETFAPSTGSVHESFRISRTVTVRVFEARLEPIDAQYNGSAAGGPAFSRCASSASLKNLARSSASVKGATLTTPVATPLPTPGTPSTPFSSNVTPPLNARKPMPPTTAPAAPSVYTVASGFITPSRDSFYTASPQNLRGSPAPTPTVPLTKLPPPTHSPHHIQYMSTYPDTYVEMFFGGRAWARTSVARPSRVPFWREDYVFKDFPGMKIPMVYFVLKRRVLPADESDGTLSNPCDDPVLGFVALSPEEIRSNGNLEKPYELTPVYARDEAWAPQYRASLSLKIAYEELTIGPAACYALIDKTLTSLASRNWARLIQSDERRDVTLLSETCLEICLSETDGLSAVKWIKSLISEEISKIHRLMIEKSGDPLLFAPEGGESRFADLKKNIDNTLFRGNSILTKSLERYMRIVGYNLLLKTVGVFAKRIMAEQPDLEMDPSRIKVAGAPGADKDSPEVTAAAQQHQKKLAQYTSFLWQLIRDAADEIPPGFKELFSHLSKELRAVLNQTEASVYNSVAGFLFLRFFCPAILNPKLFGLVRSQSVATVQRSLTLITKMMQCFANRTKFGIKEPWMIPMNEFFEAHRAELFDFFGKVLTVDAGSSTAAALAREADGAYFRYVPHPLGQNFNNPFLIDRTAAFVRLIELWKSSYCTADQLAKLTYERDSRRASSVNLDAHASTTSLVVQPQQLAVPQSQPSTRSNSITTIMSSYPGGLPVQAYTATGDTPSDILKTTAVQSDLIVAASDVASIVTTGSQRSSSPALSLTFDGSIPETLQGEDAEKYYHGEIMRLFGNASIPVEALIEDFSKLCNYIDDTVRRLRVRLEIQQETFAPACGAQYAQHMELVYDPVDNSACLVGRVAAPPRAVKEPVIPTATASDAAATAAVGRPLASPASSEASAPASSVSSEKSLTSTSTAASLPFLLSPLVVPKSGPATAKPARLSLQISPSTPVFATGGSGGGSPFAAFTTSPLSPTHEADMVSLEAALAASRSDFEAYYNGRRRDVSGATSPAQLRRNPTDSTITLRRSSSSPEHLALFGPAAHPPPPPPPPPPKQGFARRATAGRRRSSSSLSFSLSSLSPTSSAASPHSHPGTPKMPTPAGFSAQGPASPLASPAPGSSMVSRLHTRSLSAGRPATLAPPTHTAAAAVAAAAAVSHAHAPPGDAGPPMLSFSRSRYGSAATSSTHAPSALPLVSTAGAATLATPVSSSSASSHYFTPTATSPATGGIPFANPFASSPARVSPHPWHGLNLGGTGGTGTAQHKKRNSAGAILFPPMAPFAASTPATPKTPRAAASGSAAAAHGRSRSVSHPKPRPQSQIIATTRAVPAGDLAASDYALHPLYTTGPAAGAAGHHRKRNSIHVVSAAYGPGRLHHYSSQSSPLSPSAAAAAAAGLTPRTLATRSVSGGAASPVALSPQTAKPLPPPPPPSSKINATAAAAAAAAVARSASNF